MIDLAIGQDIWSQLMASSTLEVIAMTSALLYVYFSANENILCWFFGIVSAAAYLIIVIQIPYNWQITVNAYYILMGFYGWYKWSRGKLIVNELPIVKWKPLHHLWLILLGGIVGLLMGYLLSGTSSQLPYLDALITSFAFVATYMIAEKVLENWLYWIIINMAYTYLFYEQGYMLTTILYIIYVVISMIGYFKWLALYKQQKSVVN